MSRRDTKLIRYCIEDVAKQFVIDKFDVDKEQARELGKEFSKQCLEKLLERLGGKK